MRTLLIIALVLAVIAFLFMYQALGFGGGSMLGGM